MNDTDQSAAADKNLAQGHTIMAFGTPVATYQWPDAEELNQGLREVILAVEAKDGGLKRSNVGAWHSKLDFLAWKNPSVEIFRDRLRKFVLDLTRVTLTGESPPERLNFRAEGWANVLRDGGYNAMHDHPMAHWSGAYYVSGGDPDPEVPLNGRLELFDPRGPITMFRLENAIYEARFLIDPVPGLMVFFPSWLKHMVHPYRGPGERISISYNITVSVPKPPGAG